MRAVLACKLPVFRIAVFAEMAWMVRRPELGLLCRAALEDGNLLSTTTVQSALPGLSDAGASNVLEWCRVLGLCDAHGGLTALGHDVADCDEAPVPEQGCYGLWLVQHPVIGRRVLAAERLPSDRAQHPAIGQLPLEPDFGTVFRSVVDPNERFLVHALPTNHGQKGCMVGETRASCQLLWRLEFEADSDEWQLEGTIEAPQTNSNHDLRPFRTKPEADGLDLWGLVSTWASGPLARFGRWDRNEHRLAVPFEGLGEGEIDAFRTTLVLDQVDVPAKGTYSDVSLEDVPVGPASASDAQEWAMSRFDRHLSTHPAYRSRDQVRELFAKLTEATPLERFSPTLPAHVDLLGFHATDPERFWSLAAPVDLAPAPLTDDDLAAVTIGKAAAPETEPPRAVRAPKRGGR